MHLRVISAVLTSVALLWGTPTMAQNMSPVPADETLVELVPVAPRTKAERALVGRWSTGAQTSDGTSPGEIELRADGTMQLAPYGFQTVEGVWQANPSTGTVVLTVEEAGAASMGYRFERDKLVLRYANGVSQTFSRLPNPKTAPSR